MIPLIVRDNSSVYLDFDGLYTIEYQKEKEGLAYVSYVKRGKMCWQSSVDYSAEKTVEITKEGFI
ncbi:hypothetical protein [Weeksella virosa]|uniref:hypothetical protein n=1 Tax=Weeksella virosa TaxID=1014 RepID=UPI0003037D7B|nr:hypothetical protein [Weeksella virosa]VEH63952.1 Uncharacterised protein [Weeksella virosa]